MAVEYEIVVRGNNISIRNGSLGLANLTLVRTSDGPLLFDVGHYCNRGALLEGLKRRGLAPGDLKTVFLSHLHFDHSVNIDLFPNARVLAGKADWEYVSDPNPEDSYVPWMIREQLREHELELIEGEGVLSPGVKYMPVPGHTPGCYALVLDTPGGKVVLAGDAIKTYGEIIARRSSMPFGSEEDASASISRILSIADRVVPGHFPELVRSEDGFLWEDPGELDLLIK